MERVIIFSVTYLITVITNSQILGLKKGGLSNYENKYKIAVYSNLLNYTINGFHAGGELFLPGNKSFILNTSNGRFDDDDTIPLNRHKATFAEMRFYSYDNTFSIFKLLNINSVDELFYFGPYIKFIRKRALQKASQSGFFRPRFRNKDFRGSGLATGISFGKRTSLKKFFIEINLHLGVLKYYKITDLGSDVNYKELKFDGRAAFQIGYQFLLP